MAYIGLPPSNSFVSLKRQVITGDGTTSYTLDHAVASVNDVAIFVNNVRQDPATYSISSTTLQLGGSISSSDSCYVIFLGQALQTVTPATGTVTNAMLGETITVAKGGTGVTTSAALANTGNLVLIHETSSTTDVASLTIDSTYINSTYDNYFLRIYLAPATDVVKLRVRTQNLGSDMSGSSDYRWRLQRIDASTYAAQQDDVDTEIHLSEAISAGNGEGEGFQTDLFLYSPNDATKPTRIVSSFVCRNSGGNIRGEHGIAETSSRNKIINGLTFFMSSGDISAYDYKLYGLK